MDAPTVGAYRCCFDVKRFPGHPELSRHVRVVRARCECSEARLVIAFRWVAIAWEADAT